MHTVSSIHYTYRFHSLPKGDSIFDVRQLTSTCVNSHQLTSTHINSHQLSSTLINSHQLTSTLVNSHQLSSTHINSHQLSAINSHQLPSTHINSRQLSYSFDLALTGLNTYNLKVAQLTHRLAYLLRN